METTFQGDNITVVVVETEGLAEIYVPLRPICDSLGINWAAQYQRIGRDPVLSEVAKPCVVVTTTQGQPDQRRELTAIPLDYLNGWLFGISAGRVDPAIRERLIEYQRNCYRALYDAFREGRLSNDPHRGVSTDTLHAIELASAVLALARSQAAAEARLSGRLDEHDTRLDSIEAQLGDSGRHVTEDQASQISQAVKAVALAVGRASGRNEFGAVYGELYRRFGITSYKALPARRFDDALRFLTEWYQTVEPSGDLPF